MANEIKVNGTDQLLAKLKKNITLNDVRKVVMVNTVELTGTMQRATQEVLTGHWENGVFVKPTGATKRSIMPTFMNSGLTGLTGPQTEYAPYLIYGTRFMTKRDFMTGPFAKQKSKFKSDLERLMK